MNFITLGESPRVDLVPELIEIIGRNFQIREIGLLDDVSDFKAIFPKNDEDLYVSRLKDGGQVKISKKWAKNKIKNMNLSGDSVVLCTGDFGDLNIIQPSKLVKWFFNSLPKISKLAVVCPVKEQVKSLCSRWRFFAEEVDCYYYSPYENKGVFPQKRKYDFIYLDCMGYTLEHERLIGRNSDAITVSARKILGNFLRCLIL